jgi:ribonucleoside-diphosphate reductase alpha chain
MTRPDILTGRTPRVKTGCGKLYLTLNEMDGEIIEVFPKLGKSGVCANAMLEGLGRMVSLALRHGAQMSEVIEQLTGITCSTPYDDDKGWKVWSCPDAVAKCIGKYGNGKEPQN